MSVMLIKSGVLLAALLAAGAAEAASATVSIVVKPPLAIVFTPPSPVTINCPPSGNFPAGTVVTAVTTTGGDGQPVTLSLSGDTADFALSATSPPANIITGTSGVAGCSGTANVTDTVTITGTQP